MARATKTAAAPPVVEEQTPVVVEVVAEAPSEAIVQAAPAGAIVEASAFDEFSGDVDKRGIEDMLIQRYRCVQSMTRDRAKLGLAEGHFYGTLSKKGMARGIVLPIHEHRYVVERQNTDKGEFVGTSELGDPRVVAALKRNGGSYISLKDFVSGNLLVETRDVHVVFLEDDGVTPRDFGILQFDKANLTPCLLWRDERIKIKITTKAGDVKSGAQLATYFYRSVVETELKHFQKKDKDAYVYKISAFGGDWSKAVLNVDEPAHLELLRKCKEHAEMLKAGKFKVDYSDADESPAENQSSAEPEPEAEF